MFKRIATAVVGAALAATTMTACNTSDSTPYYDTMCVDYFTGIVEPYYYCQPGYLGYGTTYRPYYVHAGYNSVGVGHRATGYSRSHFTRPSKATIHTGGVPTQGGKATKAKTGNVTVKPSKTVSTKSNTGGSTKSNKGSTSKPKVNMQKPKSVSRPKTGKH